MHLNDLHKADLRKSGLNDETIAELGFYSVTADEAKSIIGLPCGAGMAVPYPGHMGYIHIKVDNPTDPKKRYMAPLNSENKLYVPPAALKISKDTKVPIIITEGEKKAAKACQEGFPCIGLSGVWNWSRGDKDKTLLQDFSIFEFHDRQVIIIYDCDSATNSHVAKAGDRLKAKLEALGAEVVLRFMPKILNIKKVGIDDFLVVKGNDEFQHFLTSRSILPGVLRNFDIVKVIKRNMVPAEFVISVEMDDGERVEIHKASVDQVMIWNGFKQAMVQYSMRVPHIVDPRKNWDQYVDAVFKNKDISSVEEGGRGADDHSGIADLIVELMSNENIHSESAEKFASGGRVFKINGRLVARGKTIRTHISRATNNRTKTSEIWSVFRRMGGNSLNMRFGDKVIWVWSIPTESIEAAKDESSAVQEEIVETGKETDDF